MLTKGSGPPSFEFYLLGKEELVGLPVDISVILISAH